MSRPLQIWEIPPEELHAICVGRFAYYDVLDLKIRRAIQNTKWGVAPNSMAEFLRMQAAGVDVDNIVNIIQDEDNDLTETLYLWGELKREFGDAPKPKI